MGVWASSGGDHHAAHPGGATEVERVDAAAGIFGRGPEAEGLHENGVEVGRGAGGVEPLEEEAFVDGGVAAVLGRRQRCGQNDRVGVGIADSNGRRAQKAGVADRIYQTVSPVGCNVGLIPDLIEADCVLVAAGKCSGKAGEGLGRGGGR